MMYREMKTADIQAVIGFWRMYFKFEPHDDEQTLARVIAKNPGLSLLATGEDEIIGTVLATFDGRKGYLQKVVVHSDFRGRGIGRNLVIKAVSGLQSEGARDIRVGSGSDVIGFYQSLGFEEKPGVVTMRLCEED